MKVSTAAGWDHARIRFKARVNPKATLDLNPSDVVSFVPMEAVGDDGSLLLDRTRPVAEVSQGYTYFENGDVSIAKITPCFENGKGAVMDGLAGGAGFGTTELIVLRPEDDVSPRFLYYVTQSSHFRRPGEAAMLGSGGQKRVPDLFVKDFETLWPSQDVQVAIASYLDAETARIDGLIKQKQELLLLLNEAELSAIERATLPATGSRRQPLKRFVDSLSTGPFGSALHSSDYISNGIAVINPTHILNGRIAPDPDVSVTHEMAESLSAYKLNPGDIVVGRRGEMGRCAVIPDDAIEMLCGTGCLMLTPSLAKVCPEYLQLVISSRASREWLSLESVGSTMENLNAEILGRLPCFIPDIKEQRRRLSDCQAELTGLANLRSHVTEEIQLLEEMRAATITDAVLGRIDVREHMKH